MYSKNQSRPLKVEFKCDHEISMKLKKYLYRHPYEGCSMAQIVGKLSYAYPFRHPILQTRFAFSYNTKVLEMVWYVWMLAFLLDQ